jgi:putative addiction module component (TIGR02574 family)
MTTKEIIDEALSLPVDQRALIADLILRSMNTPDPNIDELWAEVAVRRRDELRSGKTQPIPGDDVFKRIRERYD